MKVFISWSGEKSKAVAKALNDWIPDVLQYVTPFMSDATIDAGTRGMEEIERELGESKFGIICVTSDNYLAPWLNFEAGAISKRLGLEPTRVAPLLVDLDTNDVNTPLKQFQMKKLDKDGVYDVIRSINKMALADDENSLDEARLTTALDRCWPALRLEIEAAKAISPPLPVTRTTDDKMDEVLESVRLLADEVKQLRSLTRRTWQRTTSNAYDWTRVPAGLTGVRPLSPSGWPIPTEITTEAELNRYRNHDFQLEVVRALRDEPFKLVGVDLDEEEGPRAIYVQADAGVPAKAVARIKAQLLDLFPGMDVKVGAPKA